MSARSADLDALLLPPQPALLSSRTSGHPVAWYQGRPVGADAFLQDVLALSGRLPECSYLVNLCEDRYKFLVAFAAALVTRRTTLLPPSRARGAIDRLMADYPGSHCLYDRDVDAPQSMAFEFGTVQTPGDDVSVPADHLAAIVFTSGSTGQARPNAKYWGDLVTGAQMMRRRFDFGGGTGPDNLVATVPPQHMYGLETSILNPLVNGVSLYAGPAFFPADICAALRAVPARRTLVTTPVHLRACLDAGLQWPEMSAVISATAPLSQALAARAEQAFDCPVLEIYGSTETGSMASRRTLDGAAWLLFDAARLASDGATSSLTGPHLRGAVPLQDFIEPLDQRRFVLHGRHADMVNIAGKRASLADLNARLQEIEGVDDGAFLVPDPADDELCRLVAFVATRKLDVAAVRQALSAQIDPVFLPRPVYILDALPRNETGKLTRAALLDLLDRSRRGG